MPCVCVTILSKRREKGVKSLFVTRPPCWGLTPQTLWFVYELMLVHMVHVRNTAKILNLSLLPAADWCFLFLLFWTPHTVNHESIMAPVVNMKFCRESDVYGVMQRHITSELWQPAEPEMSLDTQTHTPGLWSGLHSLKPDLEANADVILFRCTVRV